MMLRKLLSQSSLGVGFVFAMAVPVAHAQDLFFSAQATENCFANMAEQQDPATCVGASANACMEVTIGGWSTVGMGGCLEQERLYWDGRLNTAYKKIRSAAKSMDAEMADIGSSAPKQAEALKRMQRAWIPYRDATCDYERSLWGGGTGGGPATLSCHMTLTAEQALYLEAQQGTN